MHGQKNIKSVHLFYRCELLLKEQSRVSESIAVPYLRMIATIMLSLHPAG